MPIQRSVRSPRYGESNQLSNNYQRSSISNQLNKKFSVGTGTSGAASNKNSQTKTFDSSQISIDREDSSDDINQIRQLIKEQTSLSLNVRQRTESNSSDDYDLPFRKFTPIPPIPRSDDAYFRTESKLIKDELLNDDCETVVTPTPLETQFNKSDTILFSNFNEPETTSINKWNKKETRYHFGSNSNNYNTNASLVKTNYNYNYRLPSIDRQINHHSLQNTMDLDEDLPCNPVSELEKNNQRLIYTSPGDRSIISPVKRPQAPSPLASSYRRKPNQKSGSDSDSDFL